MAFGVTADHIQPPSREDTGNCSLYVGDLPPATTEQELYSHFSTAGPIAKVQICRDGQGGNHGYGYVHFYTPSVANVARQKLNCSTLKGQSIRVMPVQRNFGAKKNANSNLYVSNIDTSVDIKMLLQEFSKFGTVASCKIATGANGISLGYGYVNFETEENARKAMESLNGTALGGKPITVTPFVKSSVRSGGNPRFTNLYTNNFIRTLEESELKEKFETFGKVTSIHLRKDAQDRPFAFVNYSNPESAQQVIAQWHGKSVEGLTLEGVGLYVQKAMNKQEREQELKKYFEGSTDDSAKSPTGRMNGGPVAGAPFPQQAPMDYYYGGGYQYQYQEAPPMSSMNTVFVKGLDPDVTTTELMYHFLQAGMVVNAVIGRAKTGAPRGFGYVQFAAPQHCHRAITELTGRPLPHRTTPLSVTQYLSGSEKASGMTHAPLPVPMLPRPPPLSKPPPTVAGKVPPKGIPWQQMQQQQLHWQQSLKQPAAYPPVRPHPGSPPMPPSQTSGYPVGMRHPMPMGMMPVPNNGRMMPPSHAAARLGELSKMSEPERRQTIRNVLFGTIRARGYSTEDTAKITNVLISQHSSDTAELIALIESPPNLDQQLDSALRTLGRK